MILHPSVLCPVDFSEASRGALRFAAATAEHFFAGLTVVTVDDPLLSGNPGRAYGHGTLVAHQKNLVRFLKDTFPQRPTVADIDLVVAIGKPAAEIRRIALDRSADLIVMSTHGRTAIRKALFGSTTEGVLRETHLPVLVTPAGDPGPATIEDLQGAVHGVLAPIDFTASSRRQVRIAHGLTEAFRTRLVLLHVLEPRPDIGRDRVRFDVIEERCRRARREFRELVNFLSPELRPELVIAEGDVAEQIGSVARSREVGAIVMGLHSTTMLGPRMGSVTYRVLCQTAIPVLALPPVASATASRPLHHEIAVADARASFAIA